MWIGTIIGQSSVVLSTQTARDSNSGSFSAEADETWHAIAIIVTITFTFAEREIWFPATIPERLRGSRRTGDQWNLNALCGFGSRDIGRGFGSRDIGR